MDASAGKGGGGKRSGLAKGPGRPPLFTLIALGRILMRERGPGSNFHRQEGSIESTREESTARSHRRNLRRDPGRKRNGFEENV